MGNQIVCPSGSDWYRRDLTLRNYQILCSLFDGTFSLSFKAQNLYNKKIKVIKVFWIDSTQTKKIVEMFNKTFEKMLKIPPYQVFGNLFSEPYVTKNGAYLIRPFLEQPLIEKITDSPPLHYWEKKWIAYQLLHAVKNLGEQGFWHGDIKPENIMVSPSLQVSLVDHAPFKPSMIGTNQPHYFIHFFSYMRSCCFLAPERITDSNKYINFFAADIFSVACVIAYMYLDGQYLFNYTTIQQLKDDSQVPLLDSIEDLNIRILLRNLIISDHRSRLRNFHKFESFFPNWFSELYDRFRFALNDGRPSAIIYSLNREFLHQILTSNNRKPKSRRKSTSSLDLNFRSTKFFDLDYNMNSSVDQFSQSRADSSLELNKLISDIRNNSNSGLGQKKNSNSNLSSPANPKSKPNSNSSSQLNQKIKSNSNSKTSTNPQINQKQAPTSNPDNTKKLKSNTNSQLNSKLNTNSNLSLNSNFSLESSQSTNSKIVPLSSLEFKHHFNSQIIQDSILELKQNSERIPIPASKEKSTPILTINNKGINSLPLQRLHTPSTISFLKKDDPLIICIPLIADQFQSKKIKFNDLSHLIHLFIHLSIRLKDPILKLTRCIPHLIGLFDHNNTAINVIAVNGIISVISSITLNSFKIRLFESNSLNDPENIDVIKMMPDYPSNYLIPHFFSSIKGSWSQQFFARLPFLIIHISRLWPSFLIEIHTKRNFIKNFVFDKFVMKPFIRSSAQVSVFFYNYQKKIANNKNKVYRKTSAYPVFACLNRFMKTIFNSKYVSELTHFYSMFIVNFQPTDLALFVKTDLMEILSKMSLLLSKQSKSDSRKNFVSLPNAKSDVLEKKMNDENDVSIMLFFYELLAFFKLNLPLPALSLIGESTAKMQLSANLRVKTIVKQILKIFPDSFLYLKFGNIPIQKLTRTVTHSVSKNFESRSMIKSDSESQAYLNRMSKFLKKIEESMTNDRHRPVFLYSQKLFQSEVNDIFVNSNSLQVTFFHSHSILSLFEMNDKHMQNFKEVRATNFHEKIDFLSRINNEQIVLSSGSKVYITSNAQLKATIKLSTAVTYQSSFNKSQLLTTMKDSPSHAQIRNLNRSLEITSKIDLEGNVPTCIETYTNQPFFVFGTDENFLYAVDARVGFPVFGANLNRPFKKIITCPCGNSYQFGVFSDEMIEFYDPRYILHSKKNSPYFDIQGQFDTVKNYCGGVMLLGRNGTFYANINGKKKAVVSLNDNKGITPLEKVDEKKYSFKLPSAYRNSLHSHMFPILSMDYNNVSGICFSGDDCGFVHLWQPPNIKYLNNV